MLCIVVLPHEAFAVFLDKLHYRRSPFGAIGYDREVSGHGRQLPALAYLVQM